MSMYTGTFQTGAKWFLKGVNSPSLRIQLALAPLGRCWYLYKYINTYCTYQRLKLCLKLYKLYRLELLLSYSKGSRIYVSVYTLWWLSYLIIMYWDNIDYGCGVYFFRHTDILISKIEHSHGPGVLWVPANFPRWYPWQLKFRSNL